MKQNGLKDHEIKGKLFVHIQVNKTNYKMGST